MIMPILWRKSQEQPIVNLLTSGKNRGTICGEEEGYLATSMS
jgi:hypothetical protein